MYFLWSVVSCEHKQRFPKFGFYQISENPTSVYCVLTFLLVPASEVPACLILTGSCTQASFLIVASKACISCTLKVMFESLTFSNCAARARSGGIVRTYNLRLVGQLHREFQLRMLQHTNKRPTSGCELQHSTGFWHIQECCITSKRSFSELSLELPQA